MDEHGALLDELTKVECPIILALYQWNSRVDIKKEDKAYDTLVKIFYAIEKDDHKFMFFVRNIEFEVTPKLIATILNVI
ncbi:unnamed protein product [Ilex paraguariensis]|uniref:Uncharacterized protein n=1 Tax=Ilex paraguariensis TaxID=185542 RepID=A0ABC8RCH9_9AQUA